MKQTMRQVATRHRGTSTRAGSYQDRETVELAVMGGSHSMMFLQGKAAVTQQTAEDLSSSSEQHQASPLSINHSPQQARAVTVPM